MRRLRPVFLAFVSLLVLSVPQALAQNQGLAVITTPIDGTTVSGIVPILGTATHPQFVRYELAFSYSPNPTDTWFTLQEPVKAPVTNEVLGRWDTTSLTDGVYTLRLRVYWTDRLFLEAFARSVRVQNAMPTPPPPETATPGVATATATPAIKLPPKSTPRPTTAVISANTSSRPANPPPSWLDNSIIIGALLTGFMLTASLFILLGLYNGFKAALRYRPRR